ncbi:YlbL family protein [Cellulomonas bogoriensis]|uniref:Signal protein PDZ n=1 Tax=Cellulomonas bogoriensis 69B4 = DSM 16987 TaxID=1386082 RepID=A0A0A0BP10_9CELL|nr:S16 family serine protease [Cellulomonas bogoriensis]KGM09680.1 signal protein PDZ [Cellulomonas bogoriensis 69B4 = DSM 16987]
MTDAHDLPPAPRTTPRAVTLAVTTLTTALLASAAFVIPVPYAVSSPGPTRDTLGEHDGAPLITIDGTDTHDSSGQLLLTTVSVAGGPGFPVSVPMMVRSWFDADRSVTPVELVFAPDETREQIDERNQALMISSQEQASVAALQELGYEVPAALVVVEAMPGTGADHVVRPDDVIVEVDEQEVDSFTALAAVMEDVEPGTTVVLGVVRDEVRYDLRVETVEDEDSGRALLGVMINPEFDLPVDVDIEIDNVGGPSAGSMFALGIIDMLTEEDETGGEVIAGTGTVDLHGDIGPIGGIRQKLAGSLRDGASWFLAPADNCDEVVGNVPDGLVVVRVETLAEARAAVQAIGEGQAQDLPACT